MEEQIYKLKEEKRELLSDEPELHASKKRKRGSEDEGNHQHQVKREKTDVEYECSVCLSVDLEKGALVPCGHVFCIGCAKEAAQKKVCPKCEKSVEVSVSISE